MSAFKAVLVCSFSILATAQGCPKVDLNLQLEMFAHPLVSPTDAVYPPELIGTFVRRNKPSKDNDAELDVPDGFPEDTPPSTQFFHVGRAGGKLPNGFFRIVFVDVPDDSNSTIQTSSTIGFVKQIGSRFLVHTPIIRGEVIENLEVWNDEQCEGYLLAEIRMLKDGFELRNLNHELLEEMIESKKIKTQKLAPSDRIILADGESIKTFIESYGDKMFEVEGERFDRIQRR